MKDSPCMVCEDRYTACHDTCEKYAGWKEYTGKAKEERRKYAAIVHEDIEKSQRLRKYRR